MMYEGGYAGRILRINHTDRTAKEENVTLETAKDYIGDAVEVSLCPVDRGLTKC